MAISLKVNGATRSVDAEPVTPLLYVPSLGTDDTECNVLSGWVGPCWSRTSDQWIKSSRVDDPARPNTSESKR